MCNQRDIDRKEKCYKIILVLHQKSDILREAIMGVVEAELSYYLLKGSKTLNLYQMLF